MAYSQVFWENRRVLRMLLSLGWEIDEGASTDKYYVLRKRVAAPGSTGASKPQQEREERS